jgi:hypothetical protein
VKEFDFVKLTLWLAGVLTLGLGVGYFLVGNWTAQTERDIKSIERVCKDVGLIAKDIKTLEDEKRNDKTPEQSDTGGIHTFFQAQGRLARIQPNTDYTLKARDRDLNTRGGYADQQFVIEFRKDQPKTREQIMMFIYNCETQSRRIKLQKAKITLDAEQAPADLWRADALTFVRRDPLRG